MKALITSKIDDSKVVVLDKNQNMVAFNHFLVTGILEADSFSFFVS